MILPIMKKGSKKKLLNILQWVVLSNTISFTQYSSVLAFAKKPSGLLICHLSFAFQLTLSVIAGRALNLTPFYTLHNWKPMNLKI